MNKPALWQPNYSISPAVASYLVTIERIRTELAATHLSASAFTRLLHQARLNSTHFSTRIEGNRLTIPEAEQVIAAPTAAPPTGREGDTAEVRNYWNARVKVEAWSKDRTPLTELLIQKIHGIVMRNRASASPYRDGQNVIRDSTSGDIVYLPPETADVPKLIREMLAWTQSSLRSYPQVPIPVIAGLLHYQFATIHPYYDGNGRTARLLTHFIMQREGYGLDGLLSLETEHGQDVASYYQALATHEHHNYYFGRATADLTNWLEYFTGLCARVFEQVSNQVTEHAEPSKPARRRASKTDRATLNAADLDARERTVLTLFDQKKSITAEDVANILGLTPRMAANYLKQWSSAEGWLEATTQARKGRAYQLRERVKSR